MFNLGYTNVSLMKKRFYTAKNKYLTSQDVNDIILTDRSFLLCLILYLFKCNECIHYSIST